MHTDDSYVPLNICANIHVPPFVVSSEIYECTEDSSKVIKKEYETIDCVGDHDPTTTQFYENNSTVLFNCNGRDYGVSIRHYINACNPQNAVKGKLEQYFDIMHAVN